MGGSRSRSAPQQQQTYHSQPQKTQQQLRPRRKTQLAHRTSTPFIKKATTRIKNKLASSPPIVLAVATADEIDEKNNIQKRKSYIGRVKKKKKSLHSAIYEKYMNRRQFFIRRDSSPLHSKPITSFPLSLRLGVWGSRALLLVVAIIYSTNFASVKYLETLRTTAREGSKNLFEHDPAEASFCRFLVSALVCVPLLLFLRLGESGGALKWRAVVRAGVECGTWMTVNYVCQAEALEQIPAGKCGFIAALGVVTVPLFAGVFHGKPIRPSVLISAALALMGVGILENIVSLATIPLSLSSVRAMLSSKWNDSRSRRGGSIGNFANSSIVSVGRMVGKGDLLALGQPLGFGLAVMRTEYHLEQFAHPQSLGSYTKDASNTSNREGGGGASTSTVLALTAVQCLTVCLLTFFWVLYDYNYDDANSTADAATSPFWGFPDLTYMWERHRLMALAWTGMVTTVGAVSLQGLALQKASATDAALIFSTEPVWGSLFAGWLLGEHPSSATYVGGSVILLACVLGSVADTASASTRQCDKDRETCSSSLLSSSAATRVTSQQRLQRVFKAKTSDLLAFHDEDDGNSLALPTVNHAGQLLPRSKKRQQTLSLF